MWQPPEGRPCRAGTLYRSGTVCRAARQPPPPPPPGAVWPPAAPRPPPLHYTAARPSSPASSEPRPRQLRTRADPGTSSEVNRRSVGAPFELSPITPDLLVVHPLRLSAKHRTVIPIRMCAAEGHLRLRLKSSRAPSAGDAVWNVALAGHDLSLVGHMKSGITEPTTLLFLWNR